MAGGAFAASDTKPLTVNATVSARATLTLGQRQVLALLMQTLIQLPVLLLPLRRFLSLQKSGQDQAPLQH